MGSFSDPKDLEGLAHFLGMSIEFLVYSVLCPSNFCFDGHFFSVVRNFWIHREHNELWLLLIICLNNILSKDHYCIVSSWCDGAYGRTYYLLVFVKASVV